MPNEITTTRPTLAPTNYTEAFEFAQHLAKSSMVPREYQGKPENILLAIQWGMEVGLAPLQAIQNIAVINGKPSVYGDALLAMVKGSPVYEDVIERFDGTGESLTAICEARRKGCAPVIAQFSVADAKRAGLWNKTGPWQSYPRRMLQMRARGFALRDAFADVLRGVITREEAEDYPVDVSERREPIDVTPKSDLDQFAALPRAESRDVVLKTDGRLYAEDGMSALTAWFRSLSDEDYEIVAPWVGTREEPGELRVIARDADTNKQAQPHDAAERPAAGRSDDGGGASPLPAGSLLDLEDQMTR